MKIISRSWQKFLLILFILAVFLTALLMFMGKIAELKSIMPKGSENREDFGESATELEQLDTKNNIDIPGIKRLNSMHKTETKSGVTLDDLRIVPPVLIKQVDPQYPKSAQKKGLQGEVIFEAEIDAEGRVKTAKILRSIHPIFISPSLKAVRQWIYRPMLLNGQPCECLAVITCIFKLTRVRKKGPVIAWRGIF